MPESHHLTTTEAIYGVLRRERERQTELTWKDLAARVGVKYQSLQAFEGGKAHPTEPTMRKWVKALGQPESLVDDWFVARTEERVAEVLGDLRGPRALPAVDIETIRHNVRNMLLAQR